MKTLTEAVEALAARSEAAGFEASELTPLVSGADVRVLFSDLDVNASELAALSMAAAEEAPEEMREFIAAAWASGVVTALLLAKLRRGDEPQDRVEPGELLIRLTRRSGGSVLLGMADGSVHGGAVGPGGSRSALEVARSALDFVAEP